MLDDEERARVGTLYKQVSPFDAKKLGAALVSRNIARHLESALRAARPKGWRPLVYCWRGGKRSGAMTHVLREIGWQAAQLDGGYKAYRREVVAQLATLPREFRYLVLCGETGSAQEPRCCEALARQGAQVLDLEQLAAHRGSVLGNLPGAPQPSQKMFETPRLGRPAQARPAPAGLRRGARARRSASCRCPDALLETHARRRVRPRRGAASTARVRVPDRRVPPFPRRSGARSRRSSTA